MKSLKKLESRGKGSLLESSRSQMFFKINAPNNFPNFTGKHLYWSLFRPASFFSTTGFFCEIFEIFKTTFLCRAPPVAASDYSKSSAVF